MPILGQLLIPAAPPTAWSSRCKVCKSNDHGLSVMQASTPPASWYTGAAVHHLEQRNVFAKNWLVRGFPRHCRQAVQMNVLNPVPLPADCTQTGTHNVMSRSGVNLAATSGKTWALRTCETRHPAAPAPAHGVHDISAGSMSCLGRNMDQKAIPYCSAAIFGEVKDTNLASV